MTYSLSATKLVTYKQCPQQYSFRYEQGISTRSAFGSADLGNALHQALAIAYRDGNTIFYGAAGRNATTVRGH